MSYADNLTDVLHQMAAAGIELRDRDVRAFPLLGKRCTVGKGGKAWYWLQEFRPDAGGTYLVGRFGSYKDGSSQKVENDWSRLSDAERARLDAERAAARAAAEAKRKAEAELAALNAAQLWRKGRAEGTSPYLDSKGVQGESCRYLPDGSLLVPLLRYDWPREQALRGVQRIWPGPRTDSRTGEALPQKVFTRDFDKPGCAVRLGTAEQAALAPLVMLVEGYATGCTVRAGTGHAYPVYVALDAGNLMAVACIVSALHPNARLLVCADDDWQTRDHAGVLNNPGRTKAKAVTRAVPRCEMVYPVFAQATRQRKDTDFNDLQAREGLDAVCDQLGRVVQAILTRYG